MILGVKFDIFILKSNVCLGTVTGQIKNKLNNFITGHI
jgi:hypothetical protein